MKLLCQFGLIITFLLSPVLLKAQSGIRLTDTFIKDMRKSNRHAVIRFSSPHLRIHPKVRYESDTSKEYIVSMFEYVIFKKRGKTYCRKIVDHCNEDCSNIQEAMSGTTRFNDSLYQWLTSKISAIRDEKILPFEYYDLFEDKMDTLQSFHPYIVELAIYSTGEMFEKDINDTNLQKWSHHYRNLNLETNKKTVLFSFYEKLEEYFRANDLRFKFYSIFQNNPIQNCTSVVSR